MTGRRQTLFAHDVTDSPPPPRPCENPGCMAAGEFRAPKGRDQLTQYWWFCLEHVRAYNASWDYYKGMSAAEIEAHLRYDTTWQRPTWPFAAGRRGPHRVRDPLDVFEEESAARARPQPPRTREDAAARRAAATLDLEWPATAAEVRERYKALVKRHHPDANGGDKAAEERFKSVVEAYATLRASLASG
jgi:hypothetical protein